MSTMMAPPTETDGKHKRGVKRISLSLPPELYEELNQMMTEKGYENRSQAVSEILRDELVTHRRHRPDEVMAGTITLFYDETKPGVQQRVSLVLRKNVIEVVASLNVLLERNYRMEVLVVQGPVRKLESIVKDLIRIKGVETGKLTLTNAILPPVYPKENLK